jgi:chemotaxis protein CheD
MYCTETKYTALAHIVLPEIGSREKSQFLIDKPGYFADIIVPKIAEFFLKKNNCRSPQLQVYIAGGADSLNKNDVFQVGSRNAEMVKKILEKYQIVPDEMDIGGNISRTVSIEINNGRVTIKRQNMIL